MYFIFASFHSKLKKQTDMRDDNSADVNNTFVISNPSLEDLDNTSVHSIKLTYVDTKRVEL